MFRYQVVIGPELGVTYDVRYYTITDDSINGGPGAAVGLLNTIAKEYDVKLEQLIYRYYLMAGGFGQNVYDVMKDGKKILEFYYMRVDENNLYYRG